MQRSILTAIVALSTLLLFGCGGAVSRLTSEPEPQLPAVVGTWRTEFPLVRDEVHGNAVRTVSFTKSRFIVVDQWSLDDGSERIWPSSGSYRIESDSEIVRISARRDEDDMVVTQEFRKSYELVGDDTLRLEDWLNSERRDHREEYDRVADPPSIIGEWEAVESSQDVHGQHRYMHTFTFRSDGTYSWTQDYTRVRDEGTDNRTLEWSGLWEHEPDELFLILTENTYTLTPPCATDTCSRYAESFDGATLRLAYAPTDAQDRVMVSVFGLEMTLDPASNTWILNELRPYGSYGLELKRN